MIYSRVKERRDELAFSVLMRALKNPGLCGGDTRHDMLVKFVYAVADTMIEESNNFTYREAADERSEKEKTPEQEDRVQPQSCYQRGEDSPKDRRV